MFTAEKAVLTSVAAQPPPSVQGLILVSDARQASAADYKANADLLKANLAYLLPWAELQRTVGRTPGAEGQ